MQPFKYKPKLNSGDLRNRIDIYGNVPYKNELLETAYKFEKIKTIWASVVPQTGKLQNQQADTILTNITHKIYTRYHKDVVEAFQDEKNKNTMYVMFKEHRFNIRFILDPYFRNESLEIFVEEVIG